MKTVKSVCDACGEELRAGLHYTVTRNFFERQQESHFCSAICVFESFRNLPLIRVRLGHQLVAEPGTTE